MVAPKLATLVLVKFFRETEWKGVIYVYGGGRCYFKLAHVVVGTGKSEIRRASQQDANSGRVSMVQS